MKDLLKVSIRQNAIYIPTLRKAKNQVSLSHSSSLLVANAAKLGFGFSEDLLIAVNSVPPKVHLNILEVLREIKGTKKSWMPLRNNWEQQEKSSMLDQVVAFFSRTFGSNKGVRLACGHLIPDSTFPLKEYNGCPFCGAAFNRGELETVAQNKALKILTLWTDTEIDQFFTDLIQSKTALDATQIDSLKLLIKQREVPAIQPKMKETSMLIIDALVQKGESEKAQFLFSNPQDVLRYLWFKKTGKLQIIPPKILVKTVAQNNQHLHAPSDRSFQASVLSKRALKLKYSRTECRMVANWLNDLKISSAKACEIMHPKRSMWVRFIRALRLAEYSQKKGFGALAEILDRFYRKDYSVWAGEVNKSRLEFDAKKALGLLKQRPSVFARSLFSNMLWFGSHDALAEFLEVADQVPARLLLSLNMYADNYFNPNLDRSIKAISGKRKRIPNHPLLAMYDGADLERMKSEIQELCLLSMESRFSKIKTESNSMYIDPKLFNMPLSIGERSETIQDLPVALMGTRFPVEGNKVRLFMQWGNGLPAQRLDMDLSCQIAYDGKVERCSYSRLTATSCKHSGDIITIPSMVGTAEYIEMNLDTLQAAGAKFVSFTCNAYSRGALNPNMVVGWMNSKHSMKVSKKTGVAYDPSCVQHQVRISQTLTKGLVFGVLDVAAREIIWLEMSFVGQVVQQLDTKGVATLLAKLESRMNIGELLTIKAKAQNLTLVAIEKADEVYDAEWAQNSAAVTQLLVD